MSHIGDDMTLQADLKREIDDREKLKARIAVLNAKEAELERLIAEYEAEHPEEFG